MTRATNVKLGSRTNVVFLIRVGVAELSGLFSVMWNPACVMAIKLRYDL